MRRSIMGFVALTGLFLASCAPTGTPTQNPNEEVKVEFNERQLEKYMTQYADQLDLSRRQQRQVTKIQRKYAKKEGKLSTLQFGKKRTLQSEKAESLLAVLTDRQIERLNELAGQKGLFKRI